VPRSLLILLLAAAPLGALQPVGRWELANVPDLPSAIERAVAPMNALVRPFARALLARINPVFRQLQVDRTESEITIQFEDRPALRLPADGTPVEWFHSAREKLRIMARMNGDDLEQTYQTTEGERTTVFHVDPGSRLLRLHVTVRSGRLPSPLTYTVAYRPGS
jgi:hypothetical protein